ncbi:MAG: hypothetical protein HKN23_17105, partial [Verrucomicrobiales bacterium]|nr:hypothetical protein [Verrucomicrobiales bacterium]
PSADNSVEAELASFEVHEDLAVELYADETLGIANPIAMHWDHDGRLWVLCTLAYAQLKPGETANDKLFILEDTDGDGKADRSTVFAEGLEMPTGFALGTGGVYLAEGPDLVFLKDVDGDDRADTRDVLLSGFGTGDTHQNISNFIFDSGGFLYFSQGLHAFSHVETPWGVSRGDRAGFWRFDPRTLRLDPFCFPSMMSQNPCGIALDRRGALFIKSNGVHLGFATPGLIPTTYKRELMQHSLIGATPGKSMGVDIVETAHLPDWLQDHAVIAGYFARQINALPLREDGSGFQTVEPVRLLVAGHESFRPVDIRTGPDGAIYIADWFNPVINHYQVSLRHPHRDYKHGRIWRLVSKDGPRGKTPDFSDVTLPALIRRLGSEEKWVRIQARRLLQDGDRESVVSAIRRWMADENPDPTTNAALIEAAGILESHRAVDSGVLEKLETSKNPFARAAAARIIGRSADPVAGSGAKLEKLARDSHPRARLEAVVALANQLSPESLPRALQALDFPIDKHLEYSLTQTVQALQESWLPAVESDSLTFAKPAHLAFALESLGGEISATIARRELAQSDLNSEDQMAFLRVLAKNGNAKDARTVLFHETVNPNLLNLLAESKLRPEGELADRLAEILDSNDPEMKGAAIQLAGIWRVPELADSIRGLAMNPGTPGNLRPEAVKALGLLGGKQAADDLREIAVSEKTPIMVYRAALEALARIDIKSAVAAAAQIAARTNDENHLAALFSPIFIRSTGPPAVIEFVSRVEPEKSIVEKISGAMNRLGRVHPELSLVLNDSLGIGPPTEKYDRERVAEIVRAVTAGQGDPETGKAVYALAQLNCIGCHQINEVGGTIGPALDAVGAGLPLDQIVDSLLYPKRQLKEGYFATAITT